MSADQPVLAGPTVTLRPLSKADAGALAAAAAESGQHFTYTRVPDGIEEAERYIAAALQDRESQDGSVRNSAYYSIVRAEWPAIRATLEKSLAGEQGP